MSDDWHKPIKQRTYVGRYCVSTIGPTVAHFDDPRYDTAVFPADGHEITSRREVWYTNKVTKYANAVATHERVCADISADRFDEDPDL